MKKIVCCILIIFLFSPLVAAIKSLTVAAPLTAFASVSAADYNAAESNAKDYIINWGLKPNNNEQAPLPPDFAGTMMEENNGIYLGGTAQKNVYLTFDLGYEAGYTSAVLDILKRNNIKAIFFLCGHYVKKEDALVQRMLDEGHAIGNHTNLHKDLPALSDEEIQRDISEFTDLYKAKYTAPVVHFRPPKGRISARVLREANKQGLKTVMWSSAIVDWGKTPIDAEKSADKLASRAHPGNIILLHISNSGTPPMLDLLIPKLTAKGYSVADATSL